MDPNYTLEVARQDLRPPKDCEHTETTLERVNLLPSKAFPALVACRVPDEKSDQLADH